VVVKKGDGWTTKVKSLETPSTDSEIVGNI
jgi:hypothetical protein